MSDPQKATEVMQLSAADEIPEDPKVVKQAEIKAKVAGFQKRLPGRRIGYILSKSTNREFFIVAPTREVWNATKRSMNDDRRKDAAMENLAVECAIEPNRLQLAEMFKTEPALAEYLAVKITKLAGYDDEEEFQDFLPA